MVASARKLMSSPSAILCVGCHSAASEVFEAEGLDSDAGAADSPPEPAGAALPDALGWTLGVAVAAGLLGIKSLNMGPIVA